MSNITSIKQQAADNFAAQFPILVQRGIDVEQCTGDIQQQVVVVEGDGPLYRDVMQAVLAVERPDFGGGGTGDEVINDRVGQQVVRFGDRGVTGQVAGCGTQYDAGRAQGPGDVVRIGQFAKTDGAVESFPYQTGFAVRLLSHVAPEPNRLALPHRIRS